MKCVFCNLKNHEVIFETKNYIFLKDKFPVVEGHSLLIPKNHVRKESELPEGFKECSDRAWKWVEDNYSEPVTFVHPPKLQDVFHYHRHFIPSKTYKRGLIVRLLKEEK